MIDAVEVRCYTVPADAPEADGTLAWDSTTMVLVQASAAPSSAPVGRTGRRPCATLIQHTLVPRI